MLICFHGRDGIGKKMVAIEFAKNMMCFSPIQGEACGNCEACQTFGNTSEFAMIEPDNQVIKVDSIRKLGEEIYLKPTHAKRKCFVINEADAMNESAQNALLKVLEEPPLYATIVLVTSNKEKLLKTIRSRVVEETFSPLSPEQLQLILKMDLNSDAIMYSLGSASRALKLADDKEIEIAKKLVDAFSSKDFLKMNHEMELIKADKNFKNECGNLLQTMSIVCYHRLKQNPSLYARYIELIEETKNKLQKNGNLDLTLDNLMIQICYR